MTGWTMLTGEGLAANPVIGNATFWGEEIAYNQGGNYHFDGWTCTGVEGNGYSYKSETFLMSGTGMASFRMGGAAAGLKVYDANTDTLIAEFHNDLFADVAFPSLANGCRLATMNSYYYDFSSYVGAELYVVIEDRVINGGWAVAFFDEINFYYEEEVDFSTMKDTVLESKVPDATERPNVELPYTLAVNKAVVKNVYNGGFENGNMTGWTVVEGNANPETAVILKEMMDLVAGSNASGIMNLETLGDEMQQFINMMTLANGIKMMGGDKVTAEMKFAIISLF